jgi:hypothetical protein
MAGPPDTYNPLNKLDDDELSSAAALTDTVVSSQSEASDVDSSNHEYCIDSVESANADSSNVDSASSHVSTYISLIFRTYYLFICVLIMCSTN